MTDRSSERIEARYDSLGASFEARIFPISDDGLALFFRDISDRVATERAHADTRALLDAVMQFSTSLIYAKDPEGRFTLVNAKLEQLLGFAPGSLVGKSDHDIFPPEIADPFRENDRLVLRERRPLTAEEQILVDGQLRTNLSVKFPLQRRDGTVFGTAGVSTDITERVRHQQETTLLAEVGLKMSETLDWDASLSAIVDVVAEQFGDYCLLDIGCHADRSQRERAHPSRNACDALRSFPSRRDVVADRPPRARPRPLHHRSNRARARRVHRRRE